MKRLKIIAIAALVLTLLPPHKLMASADPMLGEVMIVGFQYCPQGWTEANGQYLSIAENTALFSLYGITYGGDGRTTFRVPDLRGRAPIHHGQSPGLLNYPQGSIGGHEYVVITLDNMPVHSHSVNATYQTGNKNKPAGNFLAVPNIVANIYHEGPADRVMDPSMIGNTGGSQPLFKRSPFLTMRYCISLDGTYPSRS